MTKRPGRKPEGPHSGLRAALTTRITPELRKALEHAAELSGRSLGQEIENRLRDTFILEKQAAKAFGSYENFAFARLLWEGIQACESITQISPTSSGGSRWYDDPFATEAAAEVVQRLVLAFRPTGRVEPPAHLRWTPDVKSFAESVALGILDQLKTYIEKPADRPGPITAESSLQLKMFPVLHEALQHIVGRLK